MTPASMPVVDIDPFSTEFLSSPYQYHEALREAGPVVYIPKYDLYAMARYKEVQATLKDWQTFISGAGAGLKNYNHQKPDRPQSIILEADPPLHTKSRNVLNKVLSRLALEKMRSEFEEKGEEIVKKALSKQSVDGIKDIAEAFPLYVFPDAVGLQKSGRENLLPFANMCFNEFGPENDLLLKSRSEAQESIKWILEQCNREMLSTDGLGALVYAQADAGDITEDEAGMLIRALLTAGLDTTIYGITAALFSFAEHPEQWDIFCDKIDDVAFRRSAFDEAIRFQSPVQTFFRTTSTAANINGFEIPEDSKVLLFLGSANRDPRQWSNPDNFDVQRKEKGHVGFGFGIHVCVGQQLAKLEADIVLTALAKKVKKLNLVGEPSYKLNNTLRGLATLPLELEPR